MAFQSPLHLSIEKLRTVLSHFDSDAEVSVDRVRSHNKGEIRRTVRMSLREFESLVAASITEGHLAGGNLELLVPGINRRLVGHHDGVFWLEFPSGGENGA